MGGNQITALKSYIAAPENKRLTNPAPRAINLTHDN